MRQFSQRLVFDNSRNLLLVLNKKVSAPARLSRQWLLIKRSTGTSNLMCVHPTKIIPHLYLSILYICNSTLKFNKSSVAHFASVESKSRAIRIPNTPEQSLTLVKFSIIKKIGGRMQLLQLFVLFLRLLIFNMDCQETSFYRHVILGDIVTP